MTNKEWIIEQIKALPDKELAEIFCRYELRSEPFEGTDHVYWNVFLENKELPWRDYDSYEEDFCRWINQEHKEG